MTAFETLVFSRMRRSSMIRGDISSICVHSALPCVWSRGAHTCVGAPLARTEVRISIERILDRCAGIRIDDAQHGPEGHRSFRYEPTFGLRALKGLHLLFTPKQGQSRPIENFKHDGRG